MRLKNFKGLPLGKLKEKEAESGIVIEGTSAEQLAEMEKKLTGRKKDLEDATRQIRDLSSLTEIIDSDDDEPIGPHGPLLELTLEDIPEEDEDAPDPENGSSPGLVVIKASGEPVEKGPEMKVAAGIEADGEAEEETEKEPEKEKESSLDDSFSNLFEDDEDDENPLTALIRNMPDVTAQELVDDIAEIKNIIKEWQHSR